MIFFSAPSLNSCSDCRLLQHHKNLILYGGGNFNAACLQAVHPVVHLLLFHCVENLSELLNVAVGVSLLAHALETVELLIIKVEIAVVISLFAVCVLSTAHAVGSFVVVFILNSGFAAIEFAQNIQPDDEEQ